MRSTVFLQSGQILRDVARPTQRNHIRSSVLWKNGEFMNYQSVSEKLLDIGQIYLRGFGLKDEEGN